MFFWQIRCWCHLLILALTLTLTLALTLAPALHSYSYSYAYSFSLIFHTSTRCLTFKELLIACTRKNGRICFINSSKTRIVHRLFTDCSRIVGLPISNILNNLFDFSCKIKWKLHMSHDDQLFQINNLGVWDCRKLLP